MYHCPIMVSEVIAGLVTNPEGTYIDATLGGGGHSEAIVKKLRGGRLIGIDQDQDAIDEATKRLAAYPQVTIVKSNFVKIDKVCQSLGIEAVDGILMDIGVSSHQLDDGERGFSYHQDAPLDMRMDQTSDLTAYDVVNTYSEEALEELILNYGEERWAKRIAAFICHNREKKNIETTLELDAVIKSAIPKQVRMQMKHPSKKVFQAIRMEVNQELPVLDEALDKALTLLKPGGRLAVLTFHSLEDRIVKNKFRYWQEDCVCPPTSPICQCDKKREAKIITRKPLVATEEELAINPRAASAKLRIVEKTKEEAL